MPDSSAAFVTAHTALTPAALTPSIRVHLAGALTPLWQATESYLAAHNVAPPYWAFAWPGAEAISAYIGANPAPFAGRRVLDFAAGSGLAAIAAAQAGAAVDANDIDPLACAAIALNAAANDAAVTVLPGDLVGAANRWDIILCGDICYEAPMAARILPWLRACSRSATVLLADPGRKYAPQDGFREIARYTVPTSLELEDDDVRTVILARLLPLPGPGG